MDKKAAVITIVQNSGGTVRTAEYISAGMTSYEVSMLRKKGSTERIRHGFHKLSRAAKDTFKK